MLVQPKPSFGIKLEDRGVVYPSAETGSFPSFIASGSGGCDGGITWNCYKNSSNGGGNIENNDNIIYLNDEYNPSINYVVSSIATVDYNNNNNNDSRGNINYSNNNDILNIGNKNQSCSTTTTQSGSHFNIPIFLPAEQDIRQYHNHHPHHHHRHPHHHQQQQQQQKTNSSLPFSLTQTTGYFTVMPSTTKSIKQRMKKSLLSHASISSNSETSSPLSTSPPSRQTALLSSSPMTISSISSSSASSPSSLTSSTPSSFTETNYSTSDDKRYLVNNLSQNSILSTTTASPSSTMNSYKCAKGSSNMINAINNYKAENIETIDDSDDILDNSNSLYHLHEIIGGHCQADFYPSHQPLPDIWSSFGHPSPKNNAYVSSVNNDVIYSDCSDVSSAPMMTMSDYPFDDESSRSPLILETLQDVELIADPMIGEEFLMTLLNDRSMQSSCSEEDEDGSMRSDGGYSSDHTTTQSSPISNDSSSDWSGPFENKLPVFEEIQVTAPESEKRPRKRLTPSPRQKRKSTDSPNSNEKERKKPGRKPGQVSNVLHLWEFMRDLLLDPSTSNEIIQWVSKDDGVFRVVNSSEVARLWGQKKNNKKEMTYEKLSRSLRYSRLEGYFDNLPKDKNYPKKLCFKFGPKSRHFSTLGGSSAAPIKTEH